MASIGTNGAGKFNGIARIARWGLLLGIVSLGCASGEPSAPSSSSAEGETSATISQPLVDTCPNKPDGTACDDGNLCTQTDTCVSGVCKGTNAVYCGQVDQCHAWGSCVPGTGKCDYPILPDNTGCFDANVCTSGDVCRAGTCTGTAFSTGPFCDGVACRSITRLKSTGQDMCAELVGGRVDCWGSGTQNFGNTDSHLAPAPEPNLTSALDYSNSFWHSCVVQADGRIRCAGTNGNGMLGDGTYNDSPGGTFVVDDGLSEITNAAKVVAMPYSTCAVLADGVAKCWGNNNWGQLGNGTTTSTNKAVTVVNPGAAIVDIGGNSSGFVALLADHTVKFWGSIFNGAYLANTPTPTEIPGFKGAVQVSLGMDHVCAVMADSSVKCAGNNIYGALGNGSTDPTTTPTTVVELGPAKKVVSNYWHTCALLLDGTAWCWGYPGHATLGGQSNQQAANPKPIKVVGIAGATDIAGTGGFNTCVTMNGCSVECWGGEAGMGIGTGAIQSPRVARPALIPTEINSLSIKDSCFLADRNEAIFLASNSANVVIDSPVGQYNQFDNALDDAQPTSFAPGAVPVRVALPSAGNVRWTLGNSTQRIDASSPRCAVTSSGGQTQVTLGGASYATGGIRLADVCRIPAGGASSGKDEAIFVYDNTGVAKVDTTLGVNNQFDNVADRGQPSSFPPGKGAFKISLSESGDTWTLGGNSLSASASTLICQVVEKGTHDEVQIDGTSYLVPPIGPSLQPEPVGTVSSSHFYGTLAGTFAVSPSGAATYSVPISLPPGIQGVAPNLALTYSSQGDNGIAGQGWSLAGLSAIYRCQKTIHQDGRSVPIDEDDDDAYCMDGNRLFRNSDGSYRTERTDFSNITVTRDQFGRIESFLVDTKSGETHKYGSRWEGRFRNSVTSRPDIWGLDEVRDISGNYYLVHYNEFPEDNSDSLLPTSIDYTFHGDTPNQKTNHIRFRYTSRFDVRMASFAGGTTYKKRVLWLIDTGFGVYQLTYLPYKAGSPSRLQNIKYCVHDSECAQPMEFQWDEHDVTWTNVPSQTGEDDGDYGRYRLPVSITEAWRPDSSKVTNVQKQLGYQFVDIDGDSLVDVLAGVGDSDRAIYHNLGSQTKAGSSWERRTDWSLPTDHGGFAFVSGDGGDAGGRLMDVNGDGLPDLVADGSSIQIQPDKTTYVAYPVRVWINRLRDTGGWLFDESISGFAHDRSYKFNGPDRIADINGDGLPDLISFASGEVRLGKVAGGWEPLANATYRIPHEIVDGATPSNGVLDSIANWFFGDPTVGMLAHIVDFNSDGLVDVVLQKGDAGAVTSDTRYDIWINTGYGGGTQAQDTIWKRTEQDVQLLGFAANGDDIWNIDLNGDGLPDRYVFMDENSGWSVNGTPEYFEARKQDVRFGNGTGLIHVANTGEWFPGNGYASVLGQRVYVGLTDLNGDGLPDMFWGHSDNVFGPSRGVELNTGMGFARVTDQLPMMPINGANGTIERFDQRHTGTVLVDVDGDRLPEVVYAGGDGAHVTWKNHGSPPVITKFPNQMASIGVEYEYTSHPKGSGLRSGLGFPLYTPEFGYRPNDRPETAPLRVIQAVHRHTPVAGADAVADEYYGYSGLRVSLHGRGLEGFHKIRVVDTSRGIQTDTEYAQAYPYTGQVLEAHKKWWALVEGGEPADTPITDTVSTYCDNPDLVNDVGIRTCSDVVNGANPLPGTSVFVVPVSTTDTAHLPHSNASVTTTTTWGFDRAGNPKSTDVAIVGSNGQHARKVITNDYGTESATNWAWVHGKPISTKTTSSADNVPDLSHEVTFEYDGGTHLLKKRREEPGKGAPLEVHTAYDYDEFGNTIVTTVCADTLDSCVAGSNAAGHRSTTVSYNPDDFMPPISASSGLITAVDYANGLFPTKSTNALGQSEYYAYHALTGIRIQQTGPNGISSRQVLNDFGQVAKTIDRAGTSSELVTSTDSWMVSSPVAGGAQTVTVARAPTGQAVFSYHDALGRTIESRQRSRDGGFLSTFTEYDVLGRVHRVSEPSKVAPPPYWTTTEQDGLDRVTSVTKDLGDLSGTGVNRQTVVKTDRAGFTTTTLQFVTLSSSSGGATEITRTETRDAVGQLVNVTAPARVVDGAGIETDFAYDAEGHRTYTWIPSTNVVLSHTVYDLRGRKQDASDSDMGTWHYTYTGFGEVYQQTDARGQVTTQEYDKLGRLSKRTTTDVNGSTNEARWYYDTAPGAGIGKLAAMEGPDDEKLNDSCRIGIPGINASPGHRATRWFAYDDVGQVAEQSDCIDGETFASKTAYDTIGRVDTLTYPAVKGERLALKYSYAATGYLQAVADAAEASTIYWVARADNNRGDLVQEDLGNGVEVRRDENLATGWLQGQSDTATRDNVTLQASSYRYNEVGSLLRRGRNDSLSNLLDEFIYDARDRLVGSQTTSPNGAIVAFDSPSYDDLGNITSKNGREFHYGICNAGDRTAGAHALCQVANGPLHSYDGNGNLVQSGTHSAKFNVANKVMELTRRAGEGQATQATATYAYGADDLRVVQNLVNPDGAVARTVYVGLDNVGKALYERTTRGSTVEHVHYLFAGGSHAFGLRVVTTQGSASKPETRYYHTDHLGSVVAVSDESGKVVDTTPTSSTNLSFDAWGARRHSDGTPAAASEFADTPGRRGFTGHEMVSALALVNMNGRVYDPDIGRFLSADPDVQFPDVLASYNRYSYVSNNPLRYTDPTGYHLKPSTAKFLTTVGTVGMISACLTNQYACVAATAASIAINTYVMYDAGVSSGRMIGVVAVTAAAAVATWGIGASGVVGAMNLQGGTAAVTQGAISGAVGAAITSAAFDREHLGKNVLAGAAMGAVMAGVSYALEQSPALSQAQVGGTDRAGTPMSSGDPVVASRVPIVDGEGRVVGTMDVIYFREVRHGAEIRLGYKAADASGNLNWVQTVETDIPLEGKGRRFIDAPPGSKLYIPAADQSKVAGMGGYDTQFYDIPRRWDKVTGVTTPNVRWSAELSLVTVNGPPVRVVTLSYGFSTNASGAVSLAPITVVAPSPYHVSAISSIK